MASFNPGPIPANTTPFGRNQPLFSTKGIKPKSATVARNAIPVEVIDGQERRILQSGEVLARITEAGEDQTKLGPYQLGATDGRGSLDNLVGISATYAPWQLDNRDIDAGVYYDATMRQANCFIRDEDGKRIPLPDNVAAALVAKKNISITFQS